jgi:hypothetical protein
MTPVTGGVTVNVGVNVAVGVGVGVAVAVAVWVGVGDGVGVLFLIKTRNMHKQHIHNKVNADIRITMVFLSGFFDKKVLICWYIARSSCKPVKPSG